MEKSKEIFLKLIGIDTKGSIKSESHYYLGLIHTKLGDEDEAKSHFSLATFDFKSDVGE